MEILIAAFLGIIQGLTEFLPVSSSGHLLLFFRLFGASESALTLSLTAHLGTLAAVVAVMRKKILGLIKEPLGKYPRLLLASFIPSAVILLPFSGVFKTAFSGEFLSLGFFLTGVLLLVTHILSKKIKSENAAVNYKRGVIMGIAQGLAAFPAVSRSGCTVCAGVLSGADKERAAEFSFLMSIPVIAGSSLIGLITDRPSPASAPVLLACFFAAFISGCLALNIMLKVLKKTKLCFFSIYLFALSATLAVLQF